MKQNWSLLAAIFDATTIEAASGDHPNKMKFSGTLVRLDEESTKAPNGSQGHKILIPLALAEQKYKTLVGMGINYSTDLDKHQPNRKVGVIKKAWIEGNAIKVSGIIWKKDFPDAEKELKQSNLGMSFEASDIDVVDPDAKVWVLSNLCFTGAAILYKDSAAYYKTEALAASAVMSAQLITTTNGGVQMADKKKDKKVSAASSEGITASALVAALTKAQEPVLAAINALTASNVNLTNTVLASEANSIEAKAKMAAKKQPASSTSSTSTEEEDDEDDIDSAAKKKPASSSSSSSSSSEDDEQAGADDEDELEDLDESSSSSEDDPGHMNNHVEKGLGNKGDKTTVSTKGDKNKTVKASKSLSSLRASVDKLVAAREDDASTIAKLQKQLKKQARQIAAAGERTDRKSVNLSAAAASLLAKEGLDPSTMSASGEKMSVPEFDICAGKAGLTIQQKVALKTELARAGIMDEGFVRRQS